ncbi:GNAT family N-acetyltransferase [Candidatus Nomurabacteria bacterium]|nr:GNAT family N-acetyltransferase [Candidatus Nomurabacteria bacterium]
MKMAKVGTVLHVGEIDLCRLNSLQISQINKYVPLYNRWVNSPEIIEFLSGSHETIEKTARRLHDLREKVDTDWTFVVKKQGVPIGFCALNKVHAVQGYCELEIFLGDNHSRGNKYGRKIVSSLCTFGFTHLELRGIVLRVLEHNTAAIACYRHCGFNEVYRYPKVHRRKGCFYDEIIMQLNAT